MFLKRRIAGPTRDGRLAAEIERQRLDKKQADLKAHKAAEELQEALRVEREVERRVARYLLWAAVAAAVVFGAASGIREQLCGDDLTCDLLRGGCGLMALVAIGLYFFDK
jgi:hypothetical protein